MKVKEIRQMETDGKVRIITSYARGYVSRKIKDEGTITVEEYKGRYGKGYKWYSPCYCSTDYCYVNYAVLQGE